MPLALVSSHSQSVGQFPEVSSHAHSPSPQQPFDTPSPQSMTLRRCLYAATNPAPALLDIAAAGTAVQNPTLVRQVWTPLASVGLTASSTRERAQRESRERHE